ncbi:NAD(P)-dependent oxidoreductase [Pelagibacterales bacterium SAG-MED15]|nr:NAD(P)-dependent oxidoreductase [Pelagibacterales bacterium SAG-MED15]
MKILITGSQGFLARNLSKKLSKFGYVCYGVGRGKWKHSTHKKWGYYKNIKGTINDKNLHLLKNIKFDYIVHCAGGSSPNTNIINSISQDQDYEKNVTSIFTLLSYFSKFKKKPKIIFISSISVYGNTKSKKIKEENNLSPISGYSLNKAIAESFCKKFYEEKKMDILILRGTSLYGSGLKRQLIYDACLKISKRKKIFFGTGKEIRDFMNIYDFTDLIKCIIFKGFAGYNVVNAGTGVGTKISMVISYIIKKFKIKLKPKFNKLGKDENPISLVPDIRKSKDYNWYPKINLYKGLDDYIDWFKND